MFDKIRSLMLFGLAALAACSGTATIPAGGGTGTATLALVNALATGSGVQLRLDQAIVALPPTGQVSQLSVTAGTHLVALSSASGRSFGTLSFSVGPDSGRTVVVSGSTDTAVVIVSVDTAAGVPNTGHILLINSAPNVGPFDVYVYRADHPDSTLHFTQFAFGSGTPQSTSPYRFSFPFDPGTFTFDVTNPGSTTALASAVVALATGDNWTVVLTKKDDGTLALAATKQ